MKYHVTSLLVSDDTDRLGTLVSVICVETTCRNKVAAPCSSNYTLAVV